MSRKDTREVEEEVRRKGGREIGCQVEGEYRVERLTGRKGGRRKGKGEGALKIREPHWLVDGDEK